MLLVNLKVDFFLGMLAGWDPIVSALSLLLMPIIAWLISQFQL